MMDETSILAADICDGAVFRYLKSLWEECGFSDEDITKRAGDIKKEIEDSIHKIISREQQMKQDMLERLNFLLYDADKLSKELDVCFDPVLYETLSLHDALTTIERETRILQEKKSAIKEEMREISEKEAELCLCLGESMEIKVQDALPTREEIALFKERLRTLHSRKAELFSVFKNVKSKIVSSMKELESEPSEDFERTVVCGNDEEFILSAENMRKLVELEKCYENKVLERRKYINDLHHKLSNLWIRLKENETLKGDFLSTNTGIGISTVRALQQEIQRCEIRRKENIPHHLKVVREEIQELWDKCCFGRIQRLSLIEFYSEGSSEALLERLEEEVTALENFYRENRCLLVLATDYLHLWEKFLNLEEKSHDKDRLFKNRGGELLKEEKERNRIQKELPKIENELKRLVKKYEDQHNKPFYFHGEEINEKIETLWTTFNERRQQYKSSWQKKPPSSTKESGGMKRKLDFETTSSKKKQLMLPKSPRFESMADSRNVTRRRLLSPTPNMNETFISGVNKIDGGKYSAYSDFENGIKQQIGHSSRIVNNREAFRDINNTKPHIGSKASKIPMKPPRKNVGMAVHHRRKSSEFTVSQTNRKLRRSSLPDINML